MTDKLDSDLRGGANKSAAAGAPRKGNKAKASREPAGSVIPPGTPKSIAGIAKGALAILFVAAMAASYFKGDNSSYLINLVLTTLLAFIVLGLDRVSRERGKWWQIFGNALITLILIAVTAVILTILYYIPTGQPPFLDVWFRRDFRIEKPKDVSFSSNFVELIGSASAKEVEVGFPIRFREYRSKVVGNRAQQDSRMVRWTPTAGDDIMIEISLRKEGEATFTVIRGDIPAQVGFYKIDGLSRGSVYEVRVVASRHGRKSDPEFKRSGIAADETILDDQPLFPEYIIYYSGNIDDSGRINGSGILIYEYVGYRDLFKFGDDYIRDLDIVPRWIYSGQIRDNRPVGRGSLTADKRECYYAPSCLSSCEGAFDWRGQGVIVDGKCHLSMGGLTLTNNGLSPNNIGTHFREGEYLGYVKMANERTIRLGPFKSTFYGKGVLQARDSTGPRLYVGPWENGELAAAGRMVDRVDSGDLSWFKLDLLHNGWNIYRDGCGLYAKSIDNDYFVSADCLSIEIQSVKSGFSLRRSVDGNAFNGRIDGTLILNSTYRDDELNCFEADMFTVSKYVSLADWKVDCDAYERLCRLRHASTSIEFKADYPLKGSPRLRVAAGSGSLDVAMIDGKPLQPWTNRPQGEASETLASLVSLARMCGGGELSMHSVRQRVPDPCRPAAIMLARLMQCDRRIR